MKATHLLIPIADVVELKVFRDALDKGETDWKALRKRVDVIIGAKQISLNEDDIEQKALEEYERHVGYKPNPDDFNRMQSFDYNEEKREGYKQALKDLLKT